MTAISPILPLTDTATPADQAAVAEIVRSAAAAGTPLYPIGGGTSLDYGAHPARPGLGLSLAGLTRIVDYPARDLTITIEAGVTIAELAAHLAGERQRLPVDIPQAGRATVGGAVATNPSGPRRYRWGTLRDCVIGIRAVDGLGTTFSGGGRVVKNAAGYDLCRLLIGSLGTLGVITQVTFMVKPMPETSALTACEVADFEAAERLLADLVRTETLPAAIELLVGPAWRSEPLLGPPLASGIGRLVVGFEGTQPEVDWMIGELHQQWQHSGISPSATHAGAEASLLWDRLTEFPADPLETDGPAPWLAEIRVLPSQTAGCIQRLLEADPACSIQAHAGSGVILARLWFKPEQGVELVEARVRPIVAAAGGSMILLSHPAGVQPDRCTVWGPPGNGQQVMQAIKDQFDPQGILNPGRFIFPSR